MFTELKSVAEFNSYRKEPAVLAYFSANNCSVCKVLKPKIEALVSSKFPKIKIVSIQYERLPELAAECNVFVAPTLLVFFDGREYIRKSRNIALSELEQDISRLYFLLF